MGFNLTNSGPGPDNRRVVLFAHQLVLAESTSTDRLNGSNLGIFLVLELAQAEGEQVVLFLDFAVDLPGARTLERSRDSSAAVQGCPLVELLDLARSQAHTHLNTPHIANLGGSITLRGAITGGDDDLLLSLNLIALKQPRGGTFDDVDLVALGDLLDQGVHLTLGLGLRSSGLGFFFVGTRSQNSRRQHQSQQQLISVVCSQHEIGGAALNNILGFVLGGNNDSVAGNRGKAINLSTKLDLDGLALLQLNGGLLLVGP